MKPNLRSILIMISLGLCIASSALSASLTIQATGPGTFSIQGGGMDGVGGMDLTIGYDPATLTAPKVSWGGLVSGALSVANTSAPGVIRIAIIRTEPLSGSGSIAALTFSTQSGSGGLNSFSAKLIDGKGGELPVQAGIAPEATGSATAASGLGTTPGGASGQPDTVQTSSAAAPPPVASPASIGLGTVSMSGDSQPRSELRPAEPKAAAAKDVVEVKEAAERQVIQSSSEKPAEPSEYAEVKQVQTVYVSVLERFRAFQGERTPESMAALFKQVISPNISQEPAIVVSDGTATVRITIDLSAIKGSSTNFALTGAKLVSLKRADDSETWILESLPQANTLKASVTIMNSRSVIEYPLTVVPPATVSQKKEDFVQFLKDSGAKNPQFDLNGDGSHDYRDDFIYVAHYLTKSGAESKAAR
jgi:hypothetical protein